MTNRYVCQKIKLFIKKIQKIDFFGFSESKSESKYFLWFNVSTIKPSKWWIWKVFKNIHRYCWVSSQSFNFQSRKFLSEVKNFDFSPQMKKKQRTLPRINISIFFPAQKSMRLRNWFNWKIYSNCFDDWVHWTNGYWSKCMLHTSNWYCIRNGWKALMTFDWSINCTWTSVTISPFRSTSKSSWPKDQLMRNSIEIFVKIEFFQRFLWNPNSAYIKALFETFVVYMDPKPGEKYDNNQ